MNACLFCDIIGGKTPADKVYEDENSFAFLDIHPDSLGHTLLVPKIHSRNIFDINEEELAHLTRVTRKVALAIKKATDAEGVKIIMNNEPASGQVIFHSHIHIIPQFEGDNKKETPHSREEFEAIAKKISSQFA